jgi:hypothetical protein
MGVTRFGLEQVLDPAGSVKLGHKTISFQKQNCKARAHPLLSARPFHKLSVLTFRSISFFHNIPGIIEEIN